MAEKAPQFFKQNEGWNADPNAPRPSFSIVDGDLWLQFAVKRPAEFRILRFKNVNRYRFTAVNDEGWYKGQCPFSNTAPAWGEFYLIEGGTDSLEYFAPWTCVLGQEPAEKHFLFYFRDETFECRAQNWSHEKTVPPGIVFQNPDIVFNAVQRREQLKARPFAAEIEDAFKLKNMSGTVLTLKGVEGWPKTGSLVRFGDYRTRILARSRNTTDGQEVSFHDCLTGKPVPAWSTILVEDTVPDMDLATLRGMLVEEEVHPDV